MPTSHSIRAPRTIVMRPGHTRSFIESSEHCNAVENTNAIAVNERRLP